MSVVVYSMMVALGEMAALYPVSGAFTHYCARFVDPALGFATGLNYWYSWVISSNKDTTHELTLQVGDHHSRRGRCVGHCHRLLGYVERDVHGPLIDHSDQTTHPAAYMTVFLFLILAVNFLGARTFGELEFWFSSLKVIAIVGLIILGVVLMAGGGPDHDPIGFRYWRNPGKSILMFDD